MTVEQIMELVSDYASEIADIASSESVFAHIGKSRYAYRDKTLAEVRTAIEELHKDAARLEWAMHYIPGSAWRHVGVNYNAGCTREDIDAAIDAAKEST